MRRPVGDPPALPAASAPLPAWTLSGVTALVNGGSVSKAIDPDRPVRGPSVRGQLRAAWRLIQATTDLRELRRKEKALFGGIFGEDGAGGAQVASQVRVGVVEAKSQPAPAPDTLGYGLWTLRNSQGNQLHREVRAQLLLQGLPEEVVWAWVLTGGLGSRTRRGYGQVWLDELPRPRDAQAWAKRLRELAPPPGPRGWPSLAGARLLAWDPAPSADGALGGLLTVFQQARGMKSVGQKSFEGGDRLPSVQKDWLCLRERRGTLRSWPALGMPIQVRSANNHLQGVRVIKPVGADRLPSPVLLRVVPLEGGRLFLPAMILLKPWAFPKVETGDPGVGGEVRAAALDELADHLIRKGKANDLGSCS